MSQRQRSMALSGWFQTWVVMANILGRIVLIAAAEQNVDIRTGILASGRNLTDVHSRDGFNKTLYGCTPDKISGQGRNYFKYFIHGCYAISSGRLSSLVTSQSCEETRATASFLRRSGLPHISVVSTPCVLSRCSTKSLCHRQTGCTGARKVIQTLIEQDNWSEMALFHDGCADIWIDALIDDLQKFVTISLYTLSDDQSIVDSLRTTLPPRNKPLPHLVIAQANTTGFILQQALIMGMRTINYRWLLYVCDNFNPSFILDLIEHNDNLAMITKTGNADKYLQDKLQRSISTIEEAVQLVPRNFSKTSSTSRAPCTSPISGPYRRNLSQEIRNLLRDQSSEDDQLVYSEYDISSVVKADGGVARLEKIGEWKSPGLLDASGSLFPNNLSNFQNHTFLVCSTPYSFFQKKIPLGNGKYKWIGLTFELLDEIAKILNFSYTVVEPPDNGWGIEDENGTWNGMIRMVQMKEVDFAAASFSITAERSGVVDFPSPYFRDQSVIIVGRPAEDSRVLIYTRPLQLEVWLAVLAAVVICGPILWQLTHNSPNYWHGGRYLTNADGLLDVWNATWYIFGVLFQQGGYWLPAAVSGRILVSSFWFFSIAIMATYTGNLIAFLAVSKVDMPFDTLDELVQQKHYKWGTAADVALVMLFKQATFEPYVSMQKKMWTAPSYAVGLDRVREGNYAFIAEKSWSALISAEECDIGVLKEEFYPTDYGWALQKGSPYKDLFSTLINKIRESGLLVHWTLRWMPQRKCKGLGPISEARVATLRDFQGSIYVLFTGVCVGCVVLLAEAAYCRYIRPRYSKNENVGVLLSTIVRRKSRHPTVVEAAQSPGTAGDNKDIETGEPTENGINYTVDN